MILTVHAWHGKGILKRKTQQPQQNFHSTSGLFRQIDVFRRHVEVFPFLSQLFPGHFLKLLSVEEEKLDKLAELIKDNPGLVAFKEVI